MAAIMGHMDDILPLRPSIMQQRPPQRQHIIVQPPLACGSSGPADGAKPARSEARSTQAALDCRIGAF